MGSGSTRRGCRGIARVPRQAGLVALVVMLTACGPNRAEEALAGTRQLSTEICDPETGTFSIDITNPYLPFPPGLQSVLEGRDGSQHAKVQISVLDETTTVAGVTTRVVEEREWLDDDLVEVSRNFVAQASDGTVCYFGEDVDDYRDGVVVGHGGAWRAGENGARPGILMPARPEVGTSHHQEVAEGVAEDAAIIISIGEPFTTPAGAFEDTLVVHDVDPLGGEIDPKRYARDVGLIVDEDLELTSFGGGT